jgi:hypothetical protein
MQPAGVKGRPPPPQQRAFEGRPNRASPSVLASFPVASLNHDLPFLGNPKCDSVRSDDALDNFGVWAAQQRLDQAGAEHGALVYGFTRGPIEYEFIELWLGEKEQAAARQQAAILRWARIAGWAGMLERRNVRRALDRTARTEGRHAVRSGATSLSPWLLK